MPKTRPPFPAEFRREAVRLARSSGKRVAEIAAELGCSEQTLREWLKQDRIDAGEQAGLTSDERARLRQLERENRILREEREILRKAAAWFASETMRPGGSR